MPKNKGQAPAGGLQKLPRGQMGPAIVAEVDRLVAAGGITKTDAFKKIATDTGRSIGTVSVTYYRLSGKGKAKEAPAQQRRPAGSAREPVLRSASRALEALGRLILDQERELEHLRKENARFREIRRLLG